MEKERKVGLTLCAVYLLGAIATIFAIQYDYPEGAPAWTYLAPIILFVAFIYSFIVTFTEDKPDTSRIYDLSDMD